MSSAQLGAKRAREYLSHHSIEALASTTLQEFCSIGRLDAKQHYTQKKAQNDYTLSWFMIGKSFATLFKPELTESFVAEKELACLVSELEGIQARIEKLLAWRPDDENLSNYLDNARSNVNDAQCYIDDVRSYLQEC